MKILYSDEKPADSAMDDAHSLIGSNDNWKQEIEKNFNLWIREISSVYDTEPAIEEEPDLYSFYEELCVLRNEFRKESRRSHETFSRFGDTLTVFENAVKSISLELSRMGHAKEKEGMVEKKRLYLPLVEVFERFKRIENRLDNPPKAGFFSSRRSWKEAWSNLRKGFVIIGLHFEELLKKEGITRIITAGKPFDPSLMMAVETLETDEAASNTVIDEFSGGYLYHGQVLKLAEVKVITATKGGV
ncbi:MAG: nucleotide exchange factor GrpE [Desulfobacteraceae bacterium 4484_190.1]|nr:MAG: nucleotide exchange factor GrpE [Desulfobacteraceae bacterium 4484_190.1]